MEQNEIFLHMTLKHQVHLSTNIIKEPGDGGFFIRQRNAIIVC
jgi:hypothetical protein